MKLCAYHPSGVQNFRMTPRYLGNVWRPCFPNNTKLILQYPTACVRWNISTSGTVANHHFLLCYSLKPPGGDRCLSAKY